MFETIQSFFDEVSKTFRFVDALDILLVAVFLYAGLVWFQRTASRGVLIGVGGLTVVYFVARYLDMYLTSLAFQTTFAVLLFILVVVFQEDLRRMFERLSALQSVRFRKTTFVDVNIDELVASVFKMAGTYTGALIVLKGKEPLDRHLEAGINLEGALSGPVLFSIFDKNTPGHDGAVVINRDRIEQFAAHLPISKNTKEIARRGTRHSAALGLSERSDALIIVVSEERGVVSIADSGKLKGMTTAADLKKRLDKFYSLTFPNVTQPFWKRFVLQHGLLKILAIAVAIIGWFALAYDPDIVQRTFDVDIEYRKVPDSLKLDEDSETKTRITLSGSERSFRFLDPTSLKVSIDLSDAKAGLGQRYPIDQQNLRLPANLELYRIEKRTINLDLRDRPVESNGKTPNTKGDGKFKQ